MNPSRRIVGVVALVAGGWFAWQWGFCRFYVEPGYMAIVTAKSGDALPPGQILAQPDQKGIQEQVLGEGRHFLNPWLYDYQIKPIVVIPAGKVGVVTSKVGAELPPGEFLAEPGQKGIWRQVLGPGKYRLNPYGYQIDTVDAISVPVGYVGVVTSLSGKQTTPDAFAGPGEKGVRRDILQPGLYYVNPKALQVDLLEIGVNQVSLLGKSGGEVVTKAKMASQNMAMEGLQKRALAEQQEKRLDYLTQQRAQEPVADKSRAESSLMARKAAPSKTLAPAKPAAPVPQAPPTPTPPDYSNVLSLNQFVGFPSRDGFEISLDMTVEFEFLPQHIAWIYQSYGDLPAVVDKIIMPQILSVSRLKGSAYRAKDFIVGEGREKFQNDLTETLARTIEEKRIIVHDALIRHVNVPMQILDPIQQASIAVEQDLTNKEKQNTARKQAELNTELGLVEQRRQQVAQETEKLKAEILADQEKQVAQLRAEAQRQAAEIERQTALVRADKTRTLGQAQANTVTLVEGEKAKGFELRTAAFGDPAALTLWEFANNLNQDVRVNILHAGPGTLWTDLEKATLGELGGAAVLNKGR
ncbi:MAG: SPFH domain-containing protein [Candidatus Contendobacter sp.]|nr:SPFH domain-containing protein [Candidatus Contendobacter sp.]